MKCADVQNALWSGKKTEEVLQHIETCFSCQREATDMQQIIGSLRAIEVPSPSRSLVPSKEVIRETVQRNRTKPWKKILAVTAAASVLLALATGILLKNGQEAPMTQSASEVPEKDNQQQITSIPIGDPNVPAIEVGPRASIQNPEMMEAIRAYFRENTSINEVKRIQIDDFMPDSNAQQAKVTGVLVLNIELQPGIATSKFKAGPQKQQIVLIKQNGKWSVAQFAFQNEPRVEERIQQYFSNEYNVPGIKEMSLIDFTPDPQTEKNVMTGKARIEVDFAPGTKTNYQKGTNTRYVLLVKRQGVWDVIKSSTSPFSVKDAPVYYRDFEKVAQVVTGTIRDVKISIEQQDGKIITKVQSLKLTVEKNLTPSGGTIQAGETIEVVFEQEASGDLTTKLQNGKRAAIFTAQTDPALVMGATLWHSDLNYYLYEQNGQYYDLTGNVSDPLQYYKKMQSSR
ncbi:hypothetical protein [Effusibacillus consociatus]|uniref:DUF4878 domain-containing protein n=1 Tax=Effusibacillus consociatus TaxID=1117041 RepID=A0ABV9Q0V1_9BACL